MREPAGAVGRRRRRRARHGCVLVFSVAVLVTGCGGIPSEGPVRSGRVLDDPRVADRAILARGPRYDAPPEEIVRGFLRAGGDFTDSHAVARDFAVDGERWRPDSSVVVYTDDSALQIVVEQVDGKTPDGAPVTSPAPAPSPPAASPSAASPSAAPAPPTGPDTATVRISAPVVARVDKSGVYRPAAPGEVATERILLARDRGGQWRITAPPDGIMLSNAAFRFAFSQYPLYFPDRSGSYLVPDLRWFPIPNATPNTLVKWLLDGPTPWLAPAVTSGAPRGTRLGVPAVVTDEVATIDLSREALGADTAQQRLLRAQVEATLARLPEVRGIRLTVRQAEFAAARGVPGDAGEDGAPRLRVNPQVDSRPVVIDEKGALARVTGSGIVPAEGVESLGVPGAEMPAVAYDSSAYAVLVDRRSRLLHQLPGAPGAPAVLATGADLTAPSFDPRGWIWTAPAGGNGTIIAAFPGGTTTTVRARWLEGLRVVSLRLSRDGARLLVSATGKGRAWLFVGGIQRSVTGAPVRVGPPEDLVPDLVEVHDAAWVDETTVVALGRRAAGATPSQNQPWFVEVGGPSDALPPVQGARTVASAGGRADVYVGREDGVLVESTGTRWIVVGRARWPALPG